MTWFFLWIFNDDSYQLSDGTSVQSAGVQGENGLSQTGSFSWVDADGNVITTTYVADANGFQPQGAHLPQAPEVPEYVIQMLADIAAAQAATASP